ncbi:transporter substrate-binding domain-containing protein (plasmid) [Entomospira entomophila]|uniref:Transporter substrate-binding domain-containing protein n=1 Tax=Entomospira entomophila TaxID=2719988 RepID=A0A968GFE5_9SPIO|nr:transporter substrate-binding domain-containing protein [Entomospira entomophilus]NIZ41449.1 transporter substrate-binding domain-containing protein [Entomospira entomophilus]WDI36283.1 transporter substrate-binding domain-containing protein [Entomospira entomophilus]
MKRQWIPMLGLAVVMSMCFSACGGADKRESSSDKRKNIIVGLEGDYTPYNWTTLSTSDESLIHPFTGQSGYAAGYDVLMAKRIADEMGVELEIKKISWDGLILALESNNIDLIIAGMSPTQERMRAISFSDPYFVDTPELVIVVRKDGNYVNATTRADFANAMITAQQGTYHADLLEQLPSKKATLLTDYVALMQSLKSGVVDGYIAERVVAEEHLRANSDFTMVQLSGEEALVIPTEQGTTAIGLRKSDQQLREEVNQALAKISEEERREMMEHAKSAAAML